MYVEHQPRQEWLAHHAGRLIERGDLDELASRDSLHGLRERSAGSKVVAAALWEVVWRFDPHLSRRGRFGKSTWPQANPFLSTWPGDREVDRAQARETLLSDQGSPALALLERAIACEGDERWLSPDRLVRPEQYSVAAYLAETQSVPPHETDDPSDGLAPATTQELLTRLVLTGELHFILRIVDRELALVELVAGRRAADPAVLIRQRVAPLVMIAADRLDPRARPQLLLGVIWRAAAAAGRTPRLRRPLVDLVVSSFRARSVGRDELFCSYRWAD